MRLFSRRHRGSQSGPLASLGPGSPLAPGSLIVAPSDAHSAEIAEITARWPRLDYEKAAPMLTARKSITASLSRDQDLANEPDRLFSLVDDILLDLADNRLTVVASGEVE